MNKLVPGSSLYVGTAEILRFAIPLLLPKKHMAWPYPICLMCKVVYCNRTMVISTAYLLLALSWNLRCQGMSSGGAMAIKKSAQAPFTCEVAK